MSTADRRLGSVTLFLVVLQLPREARMCTVEANDDFRF
jgi:hypothetical protein